MTDDSAAIRELIAAYALALDAGDIDGCVQLFTADAQFLVYGRSFDGHDGIRKMFQDAPRGLHLTGVSRIDVRDDTATARSQVLFVRAGDLHLRPGVVRRRTGPRRVGSGASSDGGANSSPAVACPTARRVHDMTRRVALVTGAAGGQGWAIAKRLRAAGYCGGRLRSPSRQNCRPWSTNWATTK